MPTCAQLTLKCLILTVFLISDTLACSGCRLRAAIAWESLKDGDQIVWVKRDKTKGTVSFHPGSKEAKATWTVTLKGFSAAHSKTVVAPDASKLIHIRGNGLVKDVKETAMAIHYKPVAKEAAKKPSIIPVSSCIPTLVKNTAKGGPGLLWMKSAAFDKEGRLQIRNAKDETLVVNLDTAKVAKL